MKYALIGCGRISPNHIIAAKNNHLKLTAFVDLNPERAKEKVIKFDLSDENIQIYSDYIQMLEKEKPELVAIATESGKHAKIAMDCLNYGCNLIIEKPIALSIADADAIIAKGYEKKVKICACHQNRFNQSIRKIRNAVETGRFGKLLYGTAHIRWNRSQEYYQKADWRGTWEQDGGALMNQCIHNIDLLRWMMGDEIDAVFGITDKLMHPYIEAEDFGVALVRFSNGSYGIIEGTTDIYPQNLEETLYIFGEKGTVKAGGQSVNIIEEWRFSDRFDDPDEIKRSYSENPPDIYGFGHMKLYQNVIAAIHGKEELLVDAEAGKRALELVLAIYQSAHTGVPVHFPLTNCATIDYKGRFER